MAVTPYGDSMKSCLTWTAATIGVVVAVCIGGYVLRGVLGEMGLSSKEDEARSSVARAAELSGPVEDTVADNRAHLGEPLQSWSQVVCDVRSDDQGWVVQSYDQTCWHQQVDVYPSSSGDRADDLEDGAAEVIVNQTIAGRGAPEPIPADPERLSERGTSPDWDVRGDLTGESFTQVIVRGESVDTELGCSPWSVGFCTRPVSEPVMP